MAQWTSGARAALSHPAIYDLFENLVGAQRCRDILTREYIRPRTGERVLDIGCGTAAILEHLPDVDYVGYDISARYIEAATRRHGHRGRFLAARLTEQSLRDQPPFDLVIAIGLLHHLDDDEATALLRICKAAMAGNSRLITLDPCFDPAQHVLARFVIGRDRGRNVRSLDGYRALCDGVFASVVSHLRHDLLRIPYTHALLDCRA